MSKNLSTSSCFLFVSSFGTSQLHNFTQLHKADFTAGGSAWIDILDMDSMDRSDMLLERLVDHEA